MPFSSATFLASCNTSSAMVNVNLALGMEGDIRANTYLHVFNPFRHLHVKISAFDTPTTSTLYASVLFQNVFAWYCIVANTLKNLETSNQPTIDWGNITASFENAWNDIQYVLKKGMKIQTICQRSVNDIIEINPNSISVSSHRSKTGKIRCISRDEFKYVWDILSTRGVYTLHDLQRIIGKRSITCAILARLPYVAGECDKGRVSLRLRT